MKNKLLGLAGGLALVVLLGRYYSIPAIAQSVRAAVVKNIDERGRIPYQHISSCVAAPTVCTANFPPVPANKRLVIEYVSGAFNKTDGFEPLVVLQIDAHSFPLPAFLRFGSNYGVSAPVTVYGEPGQTVGLLAYGSMTQAHLTGYLIDLTQ